MNYNPLFPVAVLLGMALFFFGRVLSARVTSHQWRGVILAVALLLCLPGMSFIAYYLHLLSDTLWYIQFRSLPGVELLAAGWGFVFGILPTPVKALPFFFLRSLRWGYFAISICLLAVPFIKSVLLPLDYPAAGRDDWKNGVCLQYTASTCGPASLATVLAVHGDKKTEKEIARACYTSFTGTEIWYLIRYARMQGFTVTPMQQSDIALIPTPAILGTRYGNTGHFVTLLGREGDRYIIGDPLTGRQLLTKMQFSNRCRFDGFAVYVGR